MGATKVAHDIFFGVAPFLVGDNYATSRAELGQTAGHRLVVCKMAIAVQFGPASKAALNVIEGEGPLDVAGDLDPLPGGEISINVAAGVANFCLDRFDFRGEIDVVFIGMFAQVLQTPLQ